MGQFHDTRIVDDLVDDQIVDAGACINVAIDGYAVGLNAHDRRVGDTGGIRAQLEDHIDFSVIGEEPDRYAASRAPQRALMMRGAFAIHALR